MRFAQGQREQSGTCLIRNPWIAPGETAPSAIGIRKTDWHILPRAPRQTQVATKYIRSMRSTPTGGRPLPTPAGGAARSARRTLPTAPELPCATEASPCASAAHVLHPLRRRQCWLLHFRPLLRFTLRPRSGRLVRCLPGGGPALLLRHSDLRARQCLPQSSLEACF